MTRRDLRRVAGLAATLALAVVGASCSGVKRAAPALPRLVIVTPSETVAPREFRGAEEVLRGCAAEGSGREAVHAILPEAVARGGRESEIAAFIAAAAADPRVAALLVEPALPGSAEGFRLAREARAKAARPELFCVAGDSREDELSIQASADIVCDIDRQGRAYLIPWEAKKMGAKALVAAYSRAEAGDPRAARERSIMAAAAADLGLRYAASTTPAGADSVAYARAMTGAWLRDYGRDTALYCSDYSLTAPLIQGAVAGGGIVVDAAGQATVAAYAAALGLDLAPAKGDPGKERLLLERAVSGLGLRGRLGLWEAGYAESSVAGLAEFAFRVIAGKARKDDLAGLVAALDSASPGAAWLAEYGLDPDTGVKSANRVLLRQDVYALGRGYLQSALQAVPPKYLAIRPPSE